MANKGNRILLRAAALSTALVMMFPLAACSEGSSSTAGKSSGSSTVSSAADKSSSEAESSSGADSSEAVSSTAESSTAESSSEQDIAEVPSLKELAKELFGAEEFPENNFERTYKETKADVVGKVSLCGILKAKDICDPFDDLFGKYCEIKTKGVDPEVFDLTYNIELDNGRGAYNDGKLTGLGFYCKDEKEAKEVYSCLFDDEINSIFEEESNPGEKVKFHKTDNYLLVHIL